MRHVMIIYVYACTLKCDKVIFVKYSKGVSSVCTFELATTHRIRSFYSFFPCWGLFSARGDDDREAPFGKKNCILTSENF